jgi:hypothetical protein
MRFLNPVLMSAVLAMTGTAAAQAEDYGVFCASGKIAVDSRSQDEMKQQRGACQFARFQTRTEAENFSRKNFSGVGGACSCR